ncbi:TPA: IS21 family transposase [Legionella pneumophila]|nr:IS21 family transposase [Legionella pneumophila]HDS3856844.1 IS21 family transposase [Legionella pneumophila]HDS3863321.1 IS21 family transposase [Legionella pneumophila]
MRKLREVFRLKFEFRYSHRQIAQSVGISPGSVSEYFFLFKVSGLSWDDVSNYTEEQLEQAIYKHPTSKGVSKRPQPDWAKIRMEMQRKEVTLSLLWSEYKSQHPNGLGYTQFTKYYSNYTKTLDPVMRFAHKAGEKTFVDYAGSTMEWIEPATGVIYKAQIFVGCLGCSHLIYAEASLSQSMDDWIGSHIRMFETFGGVTEMIIPDNLKSGVNKAHRYDPDINRSYHEMALHYNVAVMPTRIVSPRDKAKVESAVQIVERQIIAPLRHQTFTSLYELNQAIKTKLDELNRKPMQRINLSRLEQFERIEKSALKQLPTHAFRMQEWRYAKVHIDYHIVVNKHFYSVPYHLISQKVEVAITKHCIEVFHQGKRVAVHERNDKPNQFSTLEEHMPKGHSEYLKEMQDASIERLLAWAKMQGPHTVACVEGFFKARFFPQQAIRAVLGLKRLAQHYGIALFEKACEQTVNLHQYRYKTVETILKHRLHMKKETSTKIINNSGQFRGAEYYKGVQ